MAPKKLNNNLKPKKKRGVNHFQAAWLEKFKWVKKHSETHAWCTLCLTPIAYDNMGEAALVSHAKPAKPGKPPTKHEKLVAAQNKAATDLSVLHFVQSPLPGKSNTQEDEGSSECSQSSTQSSQSTTQSSQQSLQSPSTKSDQSSSVQSSSSVQWSQSSSSTQSTQSSSTQSTLSAYVLPLNVARAEIRWSMKVVLSHFSLRSCLDIKDLFNSMFPDSAIAKEFACSKTKCGYLITFGLAPFFKKELIDDINESPYYSVLFDESMNRILQEEQMDLSVRYWDNKTNRVVSNYINSLFFRRANADNISQGICDRIKDLPLSKCIHLSMDGPKTNWLVFTKVQGKRKDDQLPPLENIGSCGLHIVSGALGTGLKSSSWTLKKVLKAMYNLFHDSPARRDVYITICNSSTFAEKFCPTRWVANESVAEVASSLWDNHVKVIEHYLTLCPSKRPKDNSSYETLVANKSDLLMKVKMQIFKHISHRLNTFLLCFQTDAPMMPFLPKVLSDLIRKLMSYFVTASALDKAVTPLSLIKLNVSVGGGICMNVSDIKLPTVAKSMLKKIKLSGDQKSTFRKEYRNFLIGVVEKMQERSPLQSSVARNTASFDPVTMAKEPKSAALMFGGLVDVLFEHNRLSENEADDVKAQYDDFLETTVAANSDTFGNFDFTVQRLDDFMCTHLVGNVKYRLLFKVFQFVCILSHGQASIERGFNINKDVLVENLSQQSLIAQRLVYDRIKSFDGKIHDFPITQKLILSCKSAYQKYSLAQTEKKKNNEVEIKSQKRKLKQDEIATVKRRKMDVDKAADSLKSDIEKTCIEASSKEDYDSMKVCLEKANALRSVLQEKEKLSLDLDKIAGRLEDELKNI